MENRDVLDEIAKYLYEHETITGKEFMKIYRKIKGIPEPVDTSDFTKSEKVAESVVFNEDGSYSSTTNGPTETELWNRDNSLKVSSATDSVETGRAEDMVKSENEIKPENADKSENTDKTED